MKFREAEQIWARDQFLKYGGRATDSDDFRIEDTLLSSGSCETCYFEWMGIEIINTRTGGTVQIDMTFHDVVDQIVNAGEDD